MVLGAVLLSLLYKLPLAAFLFFADPFSYEYGGVTDKNGVAYVNFHANESIESVDIVITGDDGTKVTKSFSAKAGKDYKITWKQKSKSVQYHLEVDSTVGGGSMDFEVKKVVPGGKPPEFQLLSSDEEILEKRKIRYRTKFALTRYSFEVLDLEGNAIESKESDEPVSAGSELSFTWPKSDDVFMLRFKGEDDAGANAEDRRVLWSVSIPHTEVIFDSGKSEIKASEAPKIDDAFAVLVHELDGLEKATAAIEGAQAIEAQLYIVGYTDTVGKPGKNQTLSRDRAKAIAEYFYDKGAWCEIHFAGMGERGLAVETPDSTDEARNRRAAYVLGVQKPSGAKLPGSGAWKKLAEARPRTIRTLPPLPESYLKAMAEKEGGGGGGGGTTGTGDVGDIGVGGSGDAGDGDGGGSDGYSSDSGGSGAGSDGGGGEGPPPVDKKGCSVGGPTTPVGTLALLSLMGVAGIRRRRLVGS